MSLDLVKAGWPNMAAIVCLALMPLVSLTIPVNATATGAAVEQLDELQVVAHESAPGSVVDDDAL